MGGTAILSDLHLGAYNSDDLLAYRPVLDRLRSTLNELELERIVLIGDVFDLHLSTVEHALKRAAPFFTMLGEVLRESAADPELIYVPGNHDHHPAVKLFERYTDTCITEGEWEHDEKGPRSFRFEQPTQVTTSAGDSRYEPYASYLKTTVGHGVDISLCYPVLKIGTTHLTHGHYTDNHMNGLGEQAYTALRSYIAFEDEPSEWSVRAYEDASVPFDEFLYRLAQTKDGAANEAKIWAHIQNRLPGPSRKKRPIRDFLFDRLVLPFAIKMLKERLNINLGVVSSSRFSPRQESEKAIQIVAQQLGLKGDHLVFGHTHRPFHAEIPNSDSPITVVNTGSWLYCPGETDPSEWVSQFRPGTVGYIPDNESPPQLIYVLDGWGPDEISNAMNHSNIAVG